MVEVSVSVLKLLQGILVLKLMSGGVLTLLQDVL